MEEIPYANDIGTLMFSMISSRLDLAYSIYFLSRFMSNLGKEHQNALKYLIRYINGTLYVGLMYKKSYDALILERYVDVDFARNNRDSKKSTSAYFFTLKGNCVS